jgi:uncharacterized protein YjiS (DUF1127 family)
LYFLQIGRGVGRQRNRRSFEPNFFSLQSSRYEQSCNQIGILKKKFLWMMIPVETNPNTTFNPFGNKKGKGKEMQVDGGIPATPIQPTNGNAPNHRGYLEIIEQEELSKVFREELEKQKEKERILEEEQKKALEVAKETTRKNEKREKELEENEKKRHRQILLATIEGYFQSSRFKTHLQSLERSRSELQKMSTRALDELLNEIRDILANRSKMSMITNTSMTIARGYETTITPFYNIKGFTEILHKNPEYEELLEQIVIETHLPYMPWWFRIFMIYYHMSLLTYSINNVENTREEKEGHSVLNPQEVVDDYLEIASE